jgi:hypothetical protein
MEMKWNAQYCEVGGQQSRYKWKTFIVLTLFKSLVYDLAFLLFPNKLFIFEKEKYRVCCWFCIHFHRYMSRWESVPSCGLRDLQYGRVLGIDGVAGLLCIQIFKFFFLGGKCTGVRAKWLSYVCVAFGPLEKITWPTITDFV